jgi:hypothetical protein
MQPFHSLNSKGQVRRIRRICSTEEGYLRHARRMKERLMNRGYGETGIEKQIREGLSMKREEAMKRAEKRQEEEKVRFVTTFSAYLPNINGILRRHEHYLKEEELKRCSLKTPSLSLRRGRNLGD